MILDTNALSAIADGDETIESALVSASVIALPVIVYGEWTYGIRFSRHRVQYKTWLNREINKFTILHLDLDSAELYAEIRESLKSLGKPIPSNDVWIAALAMQYKMPVLSRDGHFDVIKGLKRISW